LARVFKCCTMAARWNLSRAPERPRNRIRSKPLDAPRPPRRPPRGPRPATRALSRALACAAGPARPSARRANSAGLSVLRRQDTRRRCRSNLIRPIFTCFDVSARRRSFRWNVGPRSAGCPSSDRIFPEPVVAFYVWVGHRLSTCSDYARTTQTARERLDIVSSTDHNQAAARAASGSSARSPNSSTS
jgi:hypothetical protein